MLHNDEVARHTAKEHQYLWNNYQQLVYYCCMLCSTQIYQLSLQMAGLDGGYITFDIHIKCTYIATIANADEKINMRLV